ncbi:MAG: DUF507 family protein [Acidobacteria bacterium]|nr:DUF507 family protein [Acidobacteriota bacterium]
MSLPKEYVGHFSAELIKRLEKSGKIRIHNYSAAVEKVRQVLEEDTAQADKLNQEVRDYLEQYQERIRRDGISYQEMYKLVKKELMKKHKIVISNRPDADGSKYSRDKVIELSHKMVKGLGEAGEQVEMVDERNEVRLEIVRQMQTLLREESQMDRGIRDKIRSQKREIAEGSEEWDLLFRKYYSEQLRKLGVV